MNLYVRLMGGLGNQMFQYAKGLSALEQAPQYTNLILDCGFYEGQERKVIKNGLTGRKFDLDLFNIKYDCCEDVPPGGHILEGWFQNLEEFDNVIDEVREQFTFKIDFCDDVKEMEKEILAEENSVAIHVRRGDYIKNPTALAHHGVMDASYYSKAMKIVEEKFASVHYYVFSEDVEWCEENLKTDNPITFVDSKYNDYKDVGHLHLMSKCKYHKIANSSFSWWAAFLGNSEFTIGPKKWLADGTGSEILLDEWIKV